MGALLRRSLRLALLAWACEVLLARISSDRQAAGDLLLSLAVLCAAAALPLAAAPLLRGRLREAWTGFSCALPCTLVVFGVLSGPALALAPRRGLPLAFAVALLGVAGAAAVAAARGRRGFPGAWSTPALVLGAALAAWSLEQRALPPAELLTQLILAYAVAGWLAGGALYPNAGPRLTVPALGSLLLLAGPAAWALRGDAPVAVRWDEDAPAPTAELPDVVLLCVDTLRADVARELASYRRLAADGTEFRAVQAAGPWTLPSMGTLMTGLPPWSHRCGSGEEWVTRGLAKATPTLAELAVEQGYDTAALVHNPVLSPGLGFARGFQVWDSASVRTAWALPHARSTLEARPFAAHLASALGLIGRRPLQSAEQLADRALTVLRERRAARPLFLWVHFLDCHFPYRDAARLDGVDYAKRMLLERGDADRFRADPWWAGEAGRATLLRAYRAELEAVDRAILRILDALGPPPERGRLIVLTSDHGEEFFEHGDIEHGHALYQELLDVPLVVQGLPGREPGLGVEVPVSHADLAASLFVAIGRLPGEGPLGHPLATDPAPDRILVSENLLYPSHGQPWDSDWAARQGRWKFVYGADNALEVYDLLADPFETRDLSEQEKARAYAIPQRPDPVERESAIGGHGMSRALNALGYTQGP